MIHRMNRHLFKYDLMIKCKTGDNVELAVRFVFYVNTFSPWYSNIIDKKQ